MISDELFKGKIVIVFSLLGVFILICLFIYLLCYNELFFVFKEYGVDSILCVLVNDIFVMNVWKDD